MKMTLVAATRFEIAATVEFLENQPLQTSDQWEVLITGVGTMSATFALASHIIQSRPSLIIQAGIAGSFSNEFRPGAVVTVARELMGDLGVEEDGIFRDIFDMNFVGKNQMPFKEGMLNNPHLLRWPVKDLPQVTGLTVNEISTAQARINQLRTKYLCDIETMEGAAFHYCCLKTDLPFLQLRSISNMVGERDKNNWQLRDAIKGLNSRLQQLITEYPL